jgi:hypothetical protein
MQFTLIVVRFILVKPPINLVKMDKRFLNLVAVLCKEVATIKRSFFLSSLAFCIETIGVVSKTAHPLIIGELHRLILPLRLLMS